MSTGVPLGTVAVRRQLFAAQVLQLAAFSLDFARRHQGDARALDRQRDKELYGTSMNTRWLRQVEQLEIK